MCKGMNQLNSILDIMFQMELYSKSEKAKEDRMFREEHAKNSRNQPERLNVETAKADAIV